jgi:hypothetical protein
VPAANQLKRGYLAVLLVVVFLVNFLLAALGFGLLFCLATL